MSGVAIRFEGVPIKPGRLQARRPVSNALDRCSRYGPINSGRVGDKASDRLTVTRNDNLLTPLDAVEQRAQSVLGIKCSNLQHGVQSD